MILSISAILVMSLFHCTISLDRLVDTLMLEFSLFWSISYSPIFHSSWVSLEFLVWSNVFIFRDNNYAGLQSPTLPPSPHPHFYVVFILELTSKLQCQCEIINRQVSVEAGLDQFARVVPWSRWLRNMCSRIFSSEKPRKALSSIFSYLWSESSWLIRPQSYHILIRLVVSR